MKNFIVSSLIVLVLVGFVFINPALSDQKKFSGTECLAPAGAGGGMGLHLSSSRSANDAEAGFDRRRHEGCQHVRLWWREGIFPCCDHSQHR